MKPILESLAEWLDGGLRSIGQVAIIPATERPQAPWSLCHADERSLALETPCPLELREGASWAREIALFDDTGAYRPLRSSPDLRHGWLIELADLEGLRQAIDYLYPAAIGLWREHLSGTLTPVPLREKLQRQTGMYRSANRLGDIRAQGLVRRVCHPESACLKRILWEINAGQSVHSLPPRKFLGRGEEPAAGELPLLCQEACNILVAEARLEARNEVIVIDG